MSNVKFGLQLELKGDQLVVRGLDGTRTAVNNLERDVNSNTRSSVAASQTNRELATSFNSVSSQARAFGGVLAAIGVYQIGSDAISSIGNFEYSIAGVKAVTGATRDELIEMTAVAKELGSTTKFSASQAAEGMRFLGMAGFETNEIILAMPAALNLAAAAGLELGAAADITSNIMSAFNVEASRTTEIADALATTAASANTDISQMGEAMKFVGPVAAALDISMQDSAAAIGALSNAGIQGGSAGTGLRRVLSSLANPTKEATGLLTSMGLSIDELNPKTHSITEVVTKLKNANLSAADALTIFGDRGGPAILALTEQIPQLESLTQKINDSEGAAKRMADTLSDNLKGDWLEFLSSVEGVFLAIGDAGALDNMRGGVQDLTGLVRSLGDNLDTVGDVTTIVAGVIGGRLVAALVTAAAGANAKWVANNKLLASEVALAKSALHRAVQDQLAAQRSLAVASTFNLRAAAGTRLAAANMRVVSTQAAVNSTTAAYAGAATAAGIAARGLNGALALVGGPIGFATLAAVGIYTLQDNLGLVSGPAELATSNINKLSKSLEGLGEAQLEQTIASMTAKLMELQDASAEADRQAQDSLSSQSTIDRLNPWNDTIDAIKDATSATSEVTDQMKRLKVVEQVLFDLRNKNNNKPVGGIDGESAGEIDSATEALIKKTKIIMLENSLLVLGYTLEDAKFKAAYDNSDKLTQAFMRQQLEQKGILDGYQAEVDMLGDIEAAQEKASEKAMALANANEGAMDAFLNASIGDGLVDGFNDASKALATFVDGFGELINVQEIYNKALQDPKADQESRGKAAIKYQTAQVGLYGDMAASSKQFFDEGSSGYKNLEKVEQAFRAAELAFAISNLGVKLGLIEAETVAHVAADGVKAASSGVAAAVSSMVGLPFPLNIAALGATIAAIGALGVSIFGGSGGGGGLSSSERAQQSQGTGGVLGDASAKSESASKALALMEDHLSQGLQVSTGMLIELRTLNANIAGLGNLLGRQLDFAGGLVDVQTGYSQGGAGDAAYNAGMLGVGLGGVGAVGVLGLKALGLDEEFTKIIDEISFGAFSSIASGISSKKSTKVDEGLQILGGNVADIIDGGIVDAFAYAEIRTKKRKLGSGTKTSYSTKTESLGAEISGQFGQVIGSIYESVFAAVDLLGVGSTAGLNQFAGLSISTKGLSAEDAQKEIESVLSAFADDVALSVIPSLINFQNVGEGLFETLARVATQTVIFNDAAATLGLSFAGWSAEQTLEIADGLTSAAGGLEQFASNVSSFTDFILTDAEKFAQTQGYVASLFDRLDVALPTSTQALKDYVSGLDLSTLAHQEAFTALTGASDLLDEYYSQLEDFAESAYSFDTDLGIADGMQPLRDALAAVGLNIDIVETAAQGGIEALQALFGGLTDVQKAGLEPFTDELLGMVDSVDELAAAAQRLRDFAIGASNALLSPEKQLAATQADYEQLINAVANGDLSRVNDVVSVGQSVISQAGSTAETELDYKRIVASVSSAAYSVADLIDPRSAIDIAGEQLDVLKDIRTQLSGGKISIPQSQIDTSGAARITIGSDPELLGVMRGVDDKLAQLLNDQRDGQNAIAGHTGKMANYFERWNGNNAMYIKERV